MRVLVLLSAQLLVSSLTSSQCDNKPSCKECLRTADCAWCSQPSDNSTNHLSNNRCFKTAEISKICKEAFIENLNPSTVVHSAKNLTKISHSHQEEIVQITPQNISVSLRVNTPHTITVNYTQAEDFPVDLYYLMDMSGSMNDDVKTLRNLNKDLVNEMKKITSKFRLGFGIFMDKTVPPFHFGSSNREGKQYYGFRNKLKLTDDTSRFAETIKHESPATNVYNDVEEAVFDAIVQAAVCQKAIGWRKDARRLIVVTTDARSHMAGEGRLAGFVLPNDGECHLDENEDIDIMANHQDYASISLVNQKVVKNAINVIFAVAKDHLPFYKEVSKLVQGSRVAELSLNSDNIVRLLKAEYESIRSTVELKATSSSELVEVRFFSSCLNKSGDVEQTNKCDNNLKPGSEVNFKLELTLTSCPEDPSQRHQTINITPVGSSQALTINVTMLCDCPCEQIGNKGREEASPKCSGHGDYQCGVCSCHERYIGKTCECNSDEFQEGDNSTLSCRNNGDDVLCSGRGTCQCGTCVCDSQNSNKKVYGKYCECDNFTCEIGKNREPCSGEDHGTCECGRCRCRQGWGGTDTDGPGACDCSTDTTKCRPSQGGDLCSGHGACICGRCECKSDDTGRKYRGDYCEICPSCSETCTQLRDCVECLSYKTGPLKDTCSSNCTASHHTVQLDFKVDGSNGETPCFGEDAEGCQFQFVYYYNSDRKIILTRAQEKKTCREPVNLIAVLCGVVGTIVIVGLATLVLWKVLTTLHDRREYSKFQKEVERVKWPENKNPLYNAPVSSFSNPVYTGASEE